MSILDEKDLVSKIMNWDVKNEAITVRIGSENGVEGIRDCSLITATYSVGDVVIGSLGIIGPTRMEYPRVISSMNYIRKKINQELSKLIGNDSG